MFRRSGSTATFHVEGRAPDPRAADFCDRLAGHRFQSIERAAAEDESIGWVTPVDPTGARFALEDIDIDHAVWLRIRLDRKKLPAIWTKIHRAEAEQSRGRKLSPAERKELAQDLQQRLLPGHLPSVQLIDVLYAHAQRKLFVFSTAKRVLEALTGLFHRTFGATLVPAGPGALAAALDLERSEREWLQRVAPVRWPRLEDVASGTPPRPRPAVAAAAVATRDTTDGSDDHAAGAGDAASAARRVTTAPRDPEPDGQEAELE